MDNVEEALEYILSSKAPDGTYKQEALEMYKELQSRKKLRDKKHRQDYVNFKGDMIRKSTEKKNRNLYSYGKAI